MRTRTLRLLACTALLVFGLTTTGALAEGELVASDRTFFLRGEGCGATEEFYLSAKSGTDGYDGCGAVGGVPFQEVIHQVDGASPDTFSSRDGVPVTLDAARDITGEIRGESWFGSLVPVPGVGQVVVDVTVHGIDSANKTVMIGSASEAVINDGKAGVQVPFTIDIPDGQNQVELKSLSIDVEVHGVNYNSGNLGLEGDSKFLLPILVPAPTTP